MKGWSKIDKISKEQINEFSWFKGYMFADVNIDQGATRDYEELRYRDLGISTLGNIEGKKILDVGCGGGLYTLTFMKMGAEVYGQDISENAIERCKKNCIAYGFSPTLVVGNCEQLQFDDDTFDIVYSGDVFEHITESQKEKFISEIYRVLKPGGIFTVTTPNLKYLKLGNGIKRMISIFKLKNPFKVYIAHTHNNPDNEHHGLTTHKRLIKQIQNNLFHDPISVPVPFRKRNVPNWFEKLVNGSTWFNQKIILSAKKPIFLGYYK